MNERAKAKPETTLAGDAEKRFVLGQTAPAHRSRPDFPPTLNEIRQLAYEKWEAAGKPPGDCTRFWLQAEKELLEPQ